MNRGATYLGLLAALHQEDLLREAEQRRRSHVVRRNPSRLPAFVRRVFKGPRG